MRIAITLILAFFVILALVYLLMGAFGFSFGVRIKGNTFSENSLGSAAAAYIVPLILMACGGLYLLWRGTRRPL